MARKPIQMLHVSDNGPGAVMLLCDDGTMWRLRATYDDYRRTHHLDWTQLPSVPQ